MNRVSGRLSLINFFVQTFQTIQDLQNGKTFEIGYRYLNNGQAQYLANYSDSTFCGKNLPVSISTSLAMLGSEWQTLKIVSFSVESITGRSVIKSSCVFNFFYTQVVNIDQSQCSFYNNSKWWPLFEIFTSIKNNKIIYFKRCFLVQCTDVPFLNKTGCGDPLWSNNQHWRLGIRRSEVRISPSSNFFSWFITIILRHGLSLSWLDIKCI